MIRKNCNYLSLDKENQSAIIALNYFTCLQAEVVTGL